MFAILLLDLVDRHDVRVFELRCRRGLGLKPLAFRRRSKLAGANSFQDHDPLGPLLAGLVNNAHGAEELKRRK